ncbi:MAG: CDP-alcohol phosphatidyltransferase family protein [Candidatus Delongbacteria bacterium]|nr:CDP-alcohol phosphatidyltransferase family protein [Candidatus Delongbacteria bacterium]
MIKSVLIRDIMSWPNLCSLLRIILIPVFIVMTVRAGHQPTMVGGALLAILFLTDWADGYLARRLNRITEMGKILDPLADKLAFIAIGFYLAYFFLFPRLLVILITIREIILLITGWLMIKRSHTIPVSNRWGKYSTTVLALAYFFFYVRLLQWGIITIYLFLICFLISSFLYLKNAVRIGLNKNSPGSPPASQSRPGYRASGYQRKTFYP